MKSQKGFTLIELMIVVVVIAILAAVAMPSYTAYITRGKITEATAQLADLRVKMEQYFQDNRTYVSAGTTCGTAMPTVRYFTYSCTGTATTFTVTATGASGEGMSGFTYTINEVGTRATSASPTGWGTSTSCWVIRKGGSC